MEKQKKLVVVGSGIGGLLCGAIFSKEGYHVTVLDMNKQIGGCLQTFARDKHIFDSGVHYVGGLDKGQNLYKIFNYLGIMNQLKIERMEEIAFDKIIFQSDGKVYNYAIGYENFQASLIANFPEEKEAIKKYCKVIKDVCDHFPLYQLREGDLFKQSAYLETDTKTFIESLTTNVRLQNVLAGNNPLYAGIANKTPLYVHALVLNSYIESSYRFVNGGSQIAKLLSKIITNAGGEIFNKSEVVKFSVKNDLIDCVHTKNGKRYYGDLFISNVHPEKTMEMVDSTLIRPAYRHRLQNLENSLSCFLLNIVLKPNTFKYENTNYYSYSEENVWDSMNYTSESWPLSYCLFYSLSPHVGEYATGITLMAYMNFSEVKKWENSINTVQQPCSRGKDYEEFKKQKAEKLIDLASKDFPHLRESIHSYYAGTPLTFRDYMGTKDGAIYGIAKDYKDPVKTFISPKTKIDNLLLAGQNIKIHGVLGVAISSLVTCSLVFGLPKLITKIENAQEKEEEKRT